MNDGTEKSVRHYINYDEYEMAFEGLFIELMSLNEKLNIDYSESYKIALLLKLNEETVFDANFLEEISSFYIRFLK